MYLRYILHFRYLEILYCKVSDKYSTVGNHEVGLLGVLYCESALPWVLASATLLGDKAREDPGGQTPLGDCVP